jgi:hypothetical protein
MSQVISDERGVNEIMSNIIVQKTRRERTSSLIPGGNESILMIAFLRIQRQLIRRTRMPAQLKLRLDIAYNKIQRNFAAGVKTNFSSVVYSRYKQGLCSLTPPSTEKVNIWWICTWHQFRHATN